jgi:hypothetical protein
VRLSHTPARTSAVFDDPNLVSHGGLVPVMALAERAGLPGLLAEHVRPGGGCGANAPLLPGTDVLAIIDIDSTQKRVYGHKKQGAKFGHTKIQGKSVLVRGLNALIAAVRRRGARFSVTAPAGAAIRAAITAIPAAAWTAIRYPQAIWDDQLGCWVSDAEVAETEYTAFTTPAPPPAPRTSRRTVSGRKTRHQSPHPRKRLREISRWIEA